MLPQVSIGRSCCAPSTRVDSYRPLVGDEVIDEVVSLARDLHGVRICHVNSTGFGGGVAELLSRHVPLARGLGIAMDWRLLQGRGEFFVVTKAMHNELQGADYPLTDSDRALYLEVNEESARLLEDQYDVFLVHDPQPAALRHFAGKRGAKWIWRCHVDSSSPNPAVAGFLLPYLREYDAVVFTLEEFLLPGLESVRKEFIAPAIDPLATKNMELPDDLCRRAVADMGVALDRPLLVQVSRFDPWKDPLGVVEAYRIVKKSVPGVQLALVGALAGDDPEGAKLLARVQEEAVSDPDIFVFTNLAGVGNMEVNVFQRRADVVIQKSIREGFGLVVSEAFWKSRPVVAGRAGGIPLQFPSGFERFLVGSTEECAGRIVDLLGNAAWAHEFGQAAREQVRRRFLLPRLLRDELRLVRDLLGGGGVRGGKRGQGTMNRPPGTMGGSSRRGANPGPPGTPGGRQPPSDSL